MQFDAPLDLSTHVVARGTTCALEPVHIMFVDLSSVLVWSAMVVTIMRLIRAMGAKDVVKIQDLQKFRFISPCSFGRRVISVKGSEWGALLFFVSANGQPSRDGPVRHRFECHRNGCCDHHEWCRLLASMGKCSSDPLWMTPNCQLSCSTCPVKFGTRPAKACYISFPFLILTRRIVLYIVLEN